MPSANKWKNPYLWACLLLLFVSAVTVFVYISQAHGGKLMDDECSPACTTKECVIVSNILTSNLKLSVDPCQNFYSYACGNYGEGFGKDEGDVISNRNHRAMEIAIKDILDTIEANPGTASWKLKAVYDSCMKPDSENEALREAFKFLSELGIGPDWPNLATNFKFRNTNIATIIGKLLAYDERSIMQIENSYMNTRTSGNGKRNITIVINHELLFMEIVRPMHDLFTDFLEDFGLSFKDSETADDIWEELSAVHNRVIWLMKRGSYNSTIVTLSCLQRSDSKWEDFCKVLESFMNETANINEEFNKKYVNVLVRDIDFMQHFVPELSHFTDRAVASYLAVHFLRTHDMDLSFSLRLKKWEKYQGKMFSKKKINRWEYCVNWIAENMHVPLGYEFVQKILPKNAFNEINSIVDESIKEIVELINQQEWIMESWKENIMSLIEKQTSPLKEHKIMLFNETLINDGYEKYHITSGNFFKNMMQHRSFYMMKRGEIFRDFPRLMETSSQGALNPTGSFFEANARDTSYGFALYFGMLFPPNYFYGLERLLNLISVGALCAQEIGHNVDYALADYTQNLNRYAGQEQFKTFKEFKKRTECIRSQHSKLKFDLQGISTPMPNQLRGEEYADNIVMTVIDKIIEKHASSRLFLPGSSYTTEQLLYILFAQIRCPKTNEKKEDFYMDENQDYASNNIRIIAQIQSSKNFARAFNCTEGSYMNPISKCFAFD